MAAKKRVEVRESIFLVSFNGGLEDVECFNEQYR